MSPIPTGYFGSVMVLPLTLKALAFMALLASSVVLATPSFLAASESAMHLLRLCLPALGLVT